MSNDDLVMFFNDIVIVLINVEGVVLIGMLVGSVLGDGEVMVILLMGEVDLIIFSFMGSIMVSEEFVLLEFYVNSI